MSSQTVVLINVQLEMSVNKMNTETLQPINKKLLNILS